MLPQPAARQQKLNGMKRTIARLFKYQRVVKQLDKVGDKRIFSARLAKELGISPSQVRKDFSLLAITGQKRGGYQTHYLLSRISELIRPANRQQSIVIGMGKIGKALIQHSGFKREHIELIAGFDIKADTTQQLPVYPIEMLGEFIRKHHIKVAILAVPDHAANEVARLLVELGILGILNFTGSELVLGKELFIKNVNLKLVLKNIFYHVERRLQTQPAAQAAELHDHQPTTALAAHYASAGAAALPGSKS